MSKYKVIKSVSFNIKNENDRKCLDRIKEVNFSGYVKELILADVKRQKSKAIHQIGGGIKYVLK